MPSEDLDLLYYGDHGDKITSPLVDKLLVDGVLTQAGVDRLARAVYNKFIDQWKHLHDVVMAKYNVLNNTEVKETETIDENGDRVPDLTTDENRDTSRKQEQVITRKREAYTEEEKTDLAKQKVVKTTEPHVQQTELTKNNQSHKTTVQPGEITTGAVKPFDADAFVDREKTTKSGQDVTTDQYEGEADKVTKENIPIAPAEEVTKYEGDPDIVTRKITPNAPGEERIGYEGGPDNEHIVTKQTGNEQTSSLKTRVFNRAGNIGVQTTAQILGMDWDMWVKTNLWDECFKMADAVLTAKCY